MKAITFAAPIPRYLVTRAVGRVADALYAGPHACTRYGEIAAPALPGERWVRLRTRMGGICGSDLGIVTLQASPATSPFSSFPFVLGHESVAEVAEVGAGVRGFTPGDRVTVNPLLCCEAREIAPACPACATGHHQHCVHFTDGALPPGMLIGTARSLGGSWGEGFVAHQSQLVRVPDSMSDAEAVLAEPLACAVHAVRANLPRRDERVLVIGAGSIGLLTVAALRALGVASPVTVLARHPFQGRHAERLGASRVILARGEYLRELADAAGARLLKAIIGSPAAVGGFDHSYVCVANARGVDDALRLTRAGGTVVVLGSPTTVRGVDWTPIWLKELRLRGSLTYGAHADGAARRNAFDEAVSLIAGGQAPVGSLVTHVFPLEEYRKAFAAALGKRSAESVKVAFQFTTPRA
jgi:threonine dehydrogenase-like Zn-dependent dehydrogenase